MIVHKDYIYMKIYVLRFLAWFFKKTHTYVERYGFIVRTRRDANSADDMQNRSLLLL